MSLRQQMSTEKLFHCFLASTHTTLMEIVALYFGVYTAGYLAQE